jgi:hypothetical protein
MIWLYWLHFVFLFGLVASLGWLVYLARVYDHD